MVGMRIQKTAFNENNIGYKSVNFDTALTRALKPICKIGTKKLKK